MRNECLDKSTSHLVMHPHFLGGVNILVIQHIKSNFVIGSSASHDYAVGLSDNFFISHHVTQFCLISPTFLANRSASSLV